MVWAFRLDNLFGGKDLLAHRTYSREEWLPLPTLKRNPHYLQGIYLLSAV
jgi:hypothetical protein